MKSGREILLCIIHFGDPNLAIKAIESIKRGTLVPDIGVVSTQEDMERLPYREVLKILEDENNGYSSRLNVAAQFAIDKGYKYVIFSNNDVILRDDTIEKLYSFVGENPDAIAGPVILREDGRVESAGIRFNLLSGRHYNIFSGRDVSDIDRGVLVSDAIAGTFMMMRTDILKRIRFDEKYSFYFEDVDFCLRARQNNVKSVVLRDARIVHIGRSCIKRLDMSGVAYMVTQNHLRTFEKHTVLKSGIIRYFIKKGIVGMNVLYFLLRVKGGSGALRGILDGERMLAQEETESRV